VRERRGNGGVTSEEDTEGGRENAKGVEKVIV
jgi:hypothetical protein